jgi:8-oxo-dGTP diphosphatase
VVEYVNGLLFDDRRQAVVLIQKTKPEWQAGKWNGVGGKIEPTDESKEAAMSREFEEETGVSVESSSWQPFLTLCDEAKTWAVHFFRAFAPHNKVFSVKTMTEEVVQTFWLHSLPTPSITNIKWLIQMALSMDAERAKAFEITETY